MGGGHSKLAPPTHAPVPSPIVSHFAEAGGSAGGSEPLDGRSLCGDIPPYKYIRAWYKSMPAVCELAPVPVADIVSDGEAEAFVWDMSVGGFEELANGQGEKVHYVSALTLHTPKADDEHRANKVKRKGGCSCIRSW
ncbi:uncharacterized protein Tco025E_03375 [Trypanosoma conorhini]|uniref:Uncharacterized protein n=1 Tax=Trypanosoma conorhini TaxID=83891 RepID=A0A3R7NH22_9TRYP|nr:uncharacterized protein Tco025E_03375 [Trypanosoma conorhini]RNF22009.1 hypothetical protein Tco025E_03375 [Trypanosoma conorhini]